MQRHQIRSRTRVEPQIKQDIRIESTRRTAPRLRSRQLTRATQRSSVAEYDHSTKRALGDIGYGLYALVGPGAVPCVADSFKDITVKQLFAVAFITQTLSQYLTFI